jgi:plasmid stability protein
MLVCVRTTMNLPDGLVEEAKAYAAARGRTTTSVVVEALRRLLAEVRDEVPVGALPTYGTPGGRFLVDLEDRDALWAALDAGE